MLPKIATPSAEPSSRVVSFVADPTPARSFSTAPMIESVAGATGFSGRVAVVADPALGQDDARVEWSDGGVERNTAQIWQEIEAAIQRVTATKT